MPDLAAELTTRDAALLTVGGVVGTGIFLTTSDMARALPHPALIELAWIAAGLLTLAGAVTYAELGAMFPRAGGIYHFLREAYGPFPAFLYGWTSFLVLMSGGIAAIAAGFAEYASASVPLPPKGMAIAAIVLLTAVNHRGVRQGAATQNVLTLVKALALAALIGFGLTAPSRALDAPTGAISAGSFGVAMIAALWTYDGWYGVTFSAGELRTPGRSLPRGMIGGILAVIVLYVLVNVVYLRALPLPELAATTRVGEAAMAALFGPGAARWLAAAIMVSAFGCLASTILYSSRVYVPMAADGLFFRPLATIHPRWRTPVPSLWAQSLWSVVLVLSGTYEQLYTCVTFTVVLFQVATGAAIFVLRRTRPETPRPYRAFGYPLVPGIFVAASFVLAANTLLERHRESLFGLLLIGLGWPAYLFWRRASKPP